MQFALKKNLQIWQNCHFADTGWHTRSMASSRRMCSNYERRQYVPAILSSHVFSLAIHFGDSHFADTIDRPLRCHLWHFLQDSIRKNQCDGQQISWPWHTSHKRCVSFKKTIISRTASGRFSPRRRFHGKVTKHVKFTKISLPAYDVDSFSRWSSHGCVSLRTLLKRVDDVWVIAVRDVQVTSIIFSSINARKGRSGS